MVRAEIITIGDEILYGQILDTNTQWISLELDKLGIKTVRKSSVGDQIDEIVQILKEAQKRADVVFITGGLGPTKDDLTKKILADFFGCSLAYHEEALQDVTDFFAKRGRELSDLNRDQALLPTKCTFIPNKQGTAPAMWFNELDTIWISMPGVPFEMKSIMETEVLPRLVNYFQLPVIVHQLVKTVGIGESYLSDLIQDWELQLPSHIKLAYLPSLGIVKLRLTSFGDSSKSLHEQISHEFAKVMPLIKSYVFGYEKDELADVVGKLLIEQKSTLAGKPVRPTVYLTFKQKRYNQRTSIGKKTQMFFNKDLNKTQSYSGNPFLKDMSIIEENFGNPTRQYRLVKKAKSRLDTTRVAS
jgi:nicotinamide-nucleotide amidase